ncbi:MAG: hypothetical protein R6U29_07280 [Desulfosudaceae bacterium]
MENLILIVKMVAALLAGVAVGNWFLREAKRVKARGAPWYQAYLTLPGLIILAAIVGLPLMWSWLR